jgi:hypothetical protein
VVAEECDHIQRIYHAGICLPNCSLVYVNYLSSAIATDHLSYFSNSHHRYRMLLLIAADTVILVYAHAISYFCIMIKYCTMLLLTTNCTGSLTTCDHQLYSVSPLKTPFGLLIPLLQSSPTHNNNHSQLFLYAVSHLHSLQSYTFVTTVTYYTLTHLHWLTSQLSITFSNYHRLYIFTLRNSRRELLREFAS